MKLRPVCQLVEAFDDPVAAAVPVPLTDRVRVSRADLEGYLADLRRSAPRW